MERWHCPADLNRIMPRSRRRTARCEFSAPVIQALMRAMLDTGHDFSSGGIVGSELVGDHDTRCDTLALQELSHQLQGRLLVPAAPDQSLENVAIGIDGAP